MDAATGAACSHRNHPGTERTISGDEGSRDVPPLVGRPPPVLEHAKQAGRLAPLLDRQGQPGP